VTKGKALRFIGGFTLVFGLLGICSAGGDVHRDMLLMAVGIFCSIFGMQQP
jgi:cytochrome c biogenesis protein CcdA